MSELEGRIHVDIGLTDGRVDAVIDSRRPVLASRVFEGRDVVEVLSMVPLIFSLCGQAQSVAAVRAIESATNTPASDDVERGREILVRLESVREHVWRIFVDWPKLLGVENGLLMLAPLNQQLTGLQKCINDRGILTQRPGQQTWDLDPVWQTRWNELHGRISRLMFDPANEEGQVFPFLLLDKLVELGLAEVGAVSVPALTPLDTRFVGDVLRGDEAESFVAKPHRSGQVCETGAFPRMRKHDALQRARQTFGDGVYTRFAARVVELMEQLEELKRLFISCDQIQRCASNGIAQVEAARGRLIHCVDVEDQVVTRYRILAPTEWNFHPDGVVKRMLDSIKANHEHEWLQQVQLIIQAVDPCVAYEIAMKHKDAETSSVFAENTHA